MIIKGFKKDVRTHDGRLVTILTSVGKTEDGAPMYATLSFVKSCRGIDVSKVPTQFGFTVEEKYTNLSTKVKRYTDLVTGEIRTCKSLKLYIDDPNLTIADFKECDDVFDGIRKSGACFGR